jgi:hypothetical protein
MSGQFFVVVMWSKGRGDFVTSDIALTISHVVTQALFQRVALPRSLLILLTAVRP